MSISSVTNDDRNSVNLNTAVDDKDNTSTKRKESKVSNGTTIDGSLLNLNQDDITNKRIKARKDAMKKLLDTFESQSGVDEGLDERREHVSALNEQANDAKKELSGFAEDQDKLIEEFSIDKDGQEYSDFKLLEKQQKLSKIGRTDLLTDEEKSRLENMGPKTEYQSMALVISDMTDEVQTKLDSIKEDTENEVKAISGTQIELLKSHPMVDAQKQADAILEAVDKEIMGELLRESKDHIDETSQEEQSKAEEKKKEKEELEARIEAAKADDEEKKQKDDTVDLLDNTDVINSVNLQKANGLQQKLETEVKMMLLKQQVTTDDVKGVKVDEQI